jgi:hypothetical protein
MRKGVLGAVIALMLSATATEVRAGEAAATAPRLRVVYIHGFGGLRSAPQMVANMREYLGAVEADVSVQNYPWDSKQVLTVEDGEVRAGYSQWRAAKKAAAAEAPAFRESVFARYEAEGVPYAVVAFSLGSVVVAEALAGYTEQLTHLSGISFVGSALPSDHTFPDNVLPTGVRIRNYHSPGSDMVLRAVYRSAEEGRAAGAIGFSSVDYVVNYRVNCTHIHKPVTLATHSDYSQMAVALASLHLLDVGIIVPGTIESWDRGRVGRGSVWWNTIARYPNVDVDGVRRTVVIQHHKGSLAHFRAVSYATPKGKRYRECWGHNVHALLIGMGIVSDAATPAAAETDEPLAPLPVADADIAPVVARRLVVDHYRRDPSLVASLTPAEAFRFAQLFVAVDDATDALHVLDAIAMPPAGATVSRLQRDEERLEVLDALLDVCEDREPAQGHVQRRKHSALLDVTDFGPTRQRELQRLEGVLQRSYGWNARILCALSERALVATADGPAALWQSPADLRHYIERLDEYMCMADEIDNFAYDHAAAKRTLKRLKRLLDDWE